MNIHNSTLTRTIFKILNSSDTIIIPEEIINIIISYLRLDDTIVSSLENIYQFKQNDNLITIGKINHFWYTNYDFKMFKTNNAYYPKLNNNAIWDIFTICKSCNYCKPLYHNYVNYGNNEFPYGFILNKKINNKFTYTCKDCS